MIKNILIGLNVLGILLLGGLQKEAVEITQDIPVAMQPGQEVVVTVEIDKSDVTGFAKYQVTLDEGLTAEVVDGAGASFTFNAQKAKFIWMTLPSSKKFTLTYRIIADPTAGGSLNVDSRFSYIYQNERKNFDVPTHQIGVGTVGEMAADILKEEKSPEAPANEEASVLAERTITNVGVNQWKVDVVFKKSNLSGFAKVEENVPQGYTVIDLKSSGAVFSLNDQAVKYIWYDVPQTEETRVTYKLIPVVAMNGEEPIINGSFSYLKGEETMNIPIGIGIEEMVAEETKATTEPEETESTEVEAETESEGSANPAGTVAGGAVVAGSIAAATIEKKEDSEPEIEPEKVEEKEPVVKETPVVEETIAEEKPEPKPEKNAVDGNIVDVPMPETGVYYRVQIAAGKNNVKREEFAKRYTFNEDLKLESIDGWFKYTTGHHQVYKAARDDRTRITAKYQKFKGPFVTAYNDGERITVQEALMITNQKWYQ